MGGIARGVRLRSARARWLRPTTDRARTVLFDWLGDCVVGARVLDLFCGTGALGIEALSRGAREAVFVDLRPEALELVAQNLRMARLVDRARLVRDDALRFLRRAAKRGERFGLILADPPYAQAFRVAPLLEAAAAVLEPGGLFVLEHSARAEVPERVSRAKAMDRKRVGDAQFTIYTLEGSVIAP